MKSAARFVTLAILLVLALGTGACTSQKRMESADGRLEDLNGPVPAKKPAAARKAVVELSPAQEKALQDELMALPEGLLTFDTPPALRRNSPVRLEARLSGDFVAKLNEALERQKMLDAVRVKEVMGLRLTSGGMSVKDLTAMEQKVEGNGANWAWEVNPGALGRQALTLQLTLHLQGATGQKQRAYPVVERYVEVQDEQGGFLSTYGWWVLAILLVGAAVVLLVKKP